MERNMNFRRLFLWTTALLLLLSFGGADADSDFTGFIGSLKADQTIPEEAAGTVTSFGDYTEDLALIRTGTGVPLLQGDDFVFSADIDYSSGSRTPDISNAGCGLYFSSREDTYNYLMVTARMDGMIHLSGSNYGKYLSFKKYSYAAPNVEGSVNLSVIRNGDTVTVYLDGENVLTSENMPSFGDLLGLAVLSGTNADFGTRCEFRNIRLYTWENAPADE